MKPSKLNDRQRQMILDAKLSDAVLAERLGMSKNQISQMRTNLKREALEEQADLLHVMRISD